MFRRRRQIASGHFFRRTTKQNRRRVGIFVNITGSTLSMYIREHVRPYRSDLKGLDELPMKIHAAKGVNKKWITIFQALGLDHPLCVHHVHEDGPPLIGETVFVRLTSEFKVD